MTTSPPKIPPSFYLRLGIDPEELEGLTPEEANARVKEAFRFFANVYHPDNQRTGNAEWFAAVKEAALGLETAALRERHQPSQPLAGLQDGEVYQAGSAFKKTFGGSWTPPKPTVKTKVRARYNYAARVVKPGTWMLNETEQVAARMALGLIVVFTAVGIWQWPLPLTALHAIIVIVSLLNGMPKTAWEGLGVVFLGLILYPPTGVAILTGLVYVVKIAYVSAKLTIFGARRVWLTAWVIYRWILRRRTATTNAP